MTYKMWSRLYLLAIYGFLLINFNDAAPAMEHRMTMSKMTKDLDTSATAYVYNQRHGVPVYYVRYTNHGSGHYYQPSKPVQYVVRTAAPVASETTLPYATVSGVPLRQGTGDYGNEESLEHVVVPLNSVPRAPYYVEDRLGSNKEDGKEGSYEEKGNYEDEDSEVDEEDDDGRDGEIDSGFGGSVKGYYDGYGDGEIGEFHGDAGSNFENGKGTQHVAAEYSERGDKGVKGFKSKENFSKGESGNHDNEHEEGYYKENGGRKKGHVDEAEEHGSHEEAAKGSEGSDYGQSSYHKKGQKTKGFHNIYHKDEYKKETDFYDDDHKKGHFSEYEEKDKGYKSEEGDFKKTGHSSSGHDYEDHGKKGYYDKGHRETKGQGHDAVEGEKSHYSNQENYAAKKDSETSKSHKFSTEGH